MTNLQTNKPSKNEQSLPPLGMDVVVHCPGFSCLGYLNADGTWKNAFTHGTLPNVTGFNLLN